MVAAMEQMAVVLDAGFRVKVTEAVQRAIRDGQDVVEYLHRYGLLASPQWASHVRADTLSQAASAIEEAAPWALGMAGSHVSTAIVQRLRQRASELREKASNGLA